MSARQVCHRMKLEGVAIQRLRYDGKESLLVFDGNDIEVPIPVMYPYR